MNDTLIVAEAATMNEVQARANTTLNIISEHIQKSGFLSSNRQDTGRGVHEAVWADDFANDTRRGSCLARIVPELASRWKTRERCLGRTYALRLQRHTALCPSYID